MNRIDFHAHILPGADHGSGGIDTSRRQLMLMRDAGVSAVVATPHFYPHRQRTESFLRMREQTVAELRQGLPEGAPLIYVGAEVLVCPGMHEMEGLDQLTVRGTNVLLLEMPTTAWNRGLLDTVEEIREAGFHPVMAHIDRYPMQEVKKLLARGLSVQLNATAFSGLFGGKVYRQLIGDGSVVALGSDLHGSDPAGYNPFLKALKRLGPEADEVFARTATLLQGAAALQEEMPVPQNT